MEKFEVDFFKFTNMIINKENFAYARYADGEVLLMKGMEVGLNTQAHQIDNWSAPNKLTKVGIELLNSLKHTEPNYYYAISSKTDNLGDYNFLIENILAKNENLTFANLWINKNYKEMIKFYHNFKNDCFLICNYKAIKKNFPFNVLEIFPILDNCVNFWEKNGDNFMIDLINKVKYIKNKTFFISAGPISEIIIHNLYITNPNNQYIDVGSSIDEFVHNKKTRAYMNTNSPYSSHISKF